MRQVIQLQTCVVYFCRQPWIIKVGQLGLFEREGRSESRRNYTNSGSTSDQSDPLILPASQVLRFLLSQKQALASEMC